MPGELAHLKLSIMNYATDEEIIAHAIAAKLDVDGVIAFCERQRVSPQEATNAIALTVARRFDRGDMSFDDADSSESAP
jgi:hypothetical protein